MDRRGSPDQTEQPKHGSGHDAVVCLIQSPKCKGKLKQKISKNKKLLMF